MKTVEGITSTDSYIVQELKTPYRERMQVMQKAESGKIRPVVKTGNKVNRKMNYLSHVMEAGFSGSRASTLFAGTGGNEEIDHHIVASVRDESTWKVPLDQANFDKRQTRKSVAVVLKAVWDHILPQVTNTPDIGTVWAALWDSLFREGSDVIAGEFRSEWDNGLPSGWRWTAVLDTIINAASFRVIRKIVGARLGYDINVECLYAQGDDVIMAAKTVPIAAYIMDTYDKLGYEVHPLKTFISRNRAEFLRRSYETSGVTGYIARSTVGIRFRNPAQEEPTSKAERIYPELCQWNLISLRGAAPVQAAECFLESMRNQGLDRDTVINYILTPSSVGGGGMDTNSRFGAALLSKLNGKRRWLTLEVEKKYRVLTIKRGCWQKRIKDTEWEPDHISNLKIDASLARAWGYSENKITKEITTEFIEVDQVEPKPITSTNTVPKPEELWNLGHIPVQIRDHLKRQVVKDGTELNFMYPIVAPVIQAIRARMSRNVYERYILGDITAPGPLVENVGNRYGYVAKQWANRMVMAALSIKNIGLKKLESHLLWIEENMSVHLRKLGEYTLLAQ